MNDLFLQFQLFVGALLVFGMVGVLFWWRRLKKRRAERERKASGFVQLLISALGNQAILEVVHVVGHYRAHFRTGELSVGDYRLLAELLRRAHLKISTMHPTGLELLRDSLPRLDELIEAVDGLVKQAEAKAPFFGTPEPERELLEDVATLTQADSSLVTAKLARLGECIRIRQDTIRTLGEEKGLAKKLAFWGLVGTIVLGLLSLALAIWPPGS